MEKILPIGSIVYLNDSKHKIMIINRGVQIELEEEIQMFDYSACHYPVGLSQDKIVYFNSENIDKVLFEGYFDSEEERTQELYQQWIETEGKNITKGKVKLILEY